MKDGSPCLAPSFSVRPDGRTRALVATVGLGWLAGRLVRDHELDLAQAESLGVAQAGAAAVQALGLDVEDLSPADLQRIGESAAPLLERLGTAEIVVWDESGRVLLATDQRAVGTPAAEGDPVIEVIASREPMVTISEPDDDARDPATAADGDTSGREPTAAPDGDPGGATEPPTLERATTLRTYVPVQLEGQVIALEVIQPYAPIAERIAGSRLTVLVVLTVSLLVLWGLLMPALLRTRRRLASQNAHLAELLKREQRNVERLEELDRAKSAILTAVSHELRTPLTVVRGMLATLRQHGDRLTDERRDELIGRADANASRLNELLADLLDVDRLSRGTVTLNRREVDLASLTRRVAEEAQTGDGPLHLPRDEATARVDPTLVERIVENLLANASKHTPPGTPIWIDARRVENGVVLSVEDAGPGIPPADRPEVFEPFHRLDPDHPSPGAGVGLTLVAEFAHLHGGEVTITDREGGGARFEVWLPDEPTDRPAPDSRAPTIGRLATSEA